MVILGSGSIVAQLADADLIDEFQIVVVPVILGEGRTMFEGVKRKPDLERTEDAHLQQRQRLSPIRAGSIALRGDFR